MSDLKCMYCAEMGITNTDVFIEVVDVELGAGWICKECFIESEKEKEEHLKELEQELKAKEQECEELEFENYELNEMFDRLKAENEELKKWKENIIDLFNRTCRCKHLNEETEICGLNNKKCISINECMYRKHQTLTEIKEIAEKRNYLDYNECLDDILQKISECEGNDE